MARKRSTKSVAPSPPVVVRDNDPRIYQGGSYLNGMVVRLTIAPTDRWGSKVSPRANPHSSAEFIGFRSYLIWRSSLSGT